MRPVTDRPVVYFPDLPLDTWFGASVCLMITLYRRFYLAIKPLINIVSRATRKPFQLGRVNRRFDLAAANKGCRRFQFMPVFGGFKSRYIFGRAPAAILSFGLLT